MALRQEWLETEEWARMEMQMYGYGKPLLLPENELYSFQSALIKRFTPYVRGKNQLMVNDPKVRTLWWCWLHLDDDQKVIVNELDHDNVIDRAHKQLACHPAVLQDMLRPRSFVYYWSTAKWVEAVHGQTPKCIVQLDHSITMRLFYEMHSDPKYARHNNLAMQYLGEVGDVMAYTEGSGIDVISHTSERLILKTPNGNAQILNEQWIWFNGLEFKHGGIKALMEVRLKSLDPSTTPGIWHKPTKMHDRPFTTTCPEVEV